MCKTKHRYFLQQPRETSVVKVYKMIGSNCSNVNECQVYLSTPIIKKIKLG